MAGFVGQLFGLLNDVAEPMQTAQPRRRSPNPGAVAHPRHYEEEPRASFNNTGTQNMSGLINNTGYTKGNGNGSIVFGFVRGFADMMDGGDSSRGMRSRPPWNPNMNSAPFPPLQPPAGGLLNGNNQQLFGITNNTDIKVDGDGNGALTLGKFK
ncbi:unnamed protein product [Sphenostylis stenocarpa]|uniref:Uncharacterized protein n=1 Tax=Sphenostylis stenocarpa TaxID=92480 RepID=A0AA86SAA1_9FABA|nr:unnamed protein product [Sphenostylis stenocarpa]